MKATALFLILTIVFVSSVKINPKVSAFLETKEGADLLKQIKSSQTGDMLYTFLELHLELGGPVNELVENINKLLGGLKEKLANGTQKYRKDREKYRNIIRMLYAQIKQAKSDIAGAKQRLNSVLVPRRQHLEEKIANLQENIEKNIKRTKAAIALREHQHSVFVTRKQEHEDTIHAVDEAINLVQSLVNQNPSLVQVRILKKKLSQIKISYTKNVEIAPLVQALISLSQNFSDQGAVQKIIDLLRKLRANCVESLHQLTNAENAEVEAHKQNLKELKEELDGFHDDLSQTKSELVDTKEKIEKTIQFIKKRIVDLANLRGKVRKLRIWWKKTRTCWYNLRRQLHREIRTVYAAIKAFQGIQTRRYLYERANSD